MKNISKEILQGLRPEVDLQEQVERFLEVVFKDTEHEIREEFIKGICFEELIGVLLLMRDKLEQEDDPFYSSRAMDE